MIYIAEITPTNNPPEGCLNIMANSVPDKFLFYTQIPIELVADKTEIVNRVIAYCTWNELPVPAPNEVLVKTSFM